MDNPLTAYEKLNRETHLPASFISHAAKEVGEIYQNLALGVALQAVYCKENRILLPWEGTDREANIERAKHIVTLAPPQNQEAFWERMSHVAHVRKATDKDNLRGTVREYRQDRIAEVCIFPYVCEVRQYQNGEHVCRVNVETGIENADTGQMFRLDDQLFFALLFPLRNDKIPLNASAWHTPEELEERLSLDLESDCKPLHGALTALSKLHDHYAEVIGAAAARATEQLPGYQAFRE